MSEKRPVPYPAELGYRMPAESEPHHATWLSWPHKHDTWPGRFETVEPAITAIVRALVDSEPVFINHRLTHA